MEKDKTKDIFKAVKKDFTNKIGKYTHQRISGDWHFHGLAFVREEMTYVFGFNIGFFKEQKDVNYDTVGMNVLVRTNGSNQKLRKKYSDFFKENLKYWYYTIGTYSSFRGGEGTEFKRYKPLSEFENDEQIIEFLKESINEFQKIYPIIAENPDEMFDEVQRAAYPWIDSIIDICLDALENN